MMVGCHTPCTIDHGTLPPVMSDYVRFLIGKSWNSMGHGFQFAKSHWKRIIPLLFRLFHVWPKRRRPRKHPAALARGGVGVPRGWSKWTTSRVQHLCWLMIIGYSRGLYYPVSWGLSYPLWEILLTSRDDGGFWRLLKWQSHGHVVNPIIRFGDEFSTHLRSH